VALTRTRDFRYAVVRAQARTTAGTLDFVGPTGFGTPKAARFFWSNAHTDETNNLSFRGGVGATDGTNQYGIGVMGRHGQTTTFNQRSCDTSQVLLQLNTSGGVLGKAHWDSWITDGVRVDFPATFAFAAGNIITCVLFAGADANFAVGSKTSSVTQDATASETGLGFDPNVLIADSIRNAGDTTPTVRADIKLMSGFAIDDGGSAPFPQFSLSHFAEDNNSVAELLGANTSDLYIAQHIILTGSPSGPTLSSAIEVTDWLTGGFEITTRNAAESFTIHYLAIDTGGAAVHAEHLDSRSGTPATQVISGLDFEPGLALNLFSLNNGSVDLVKGTDLADGFGWGASANQTAGEGASSMSQDSGATTSICRAYTDDKAVYMGIQSGTDYVHGTIGSGSGSWNDDGVTIDYTNVISTSKHVLWLLFENTPLVAEVNETVDITEGLLRSRALVRQVDETVDITEGILRSLGLLRLVNETVDITEGLLRLRDLVRQVDETVDITEGLLRSRALLRQLDETVAIEEEILRLRGLVKTLNETVDISESVLIAEMILTQVIDIARGTVAQARMASGRILSIRELGAGMISRAGMRAGRVVSEILAAEGVLSRAGLAAGVFAFDRAQGVVSRAGLASGLILMEGPQGVISRAGMAAGRIVGPRDVQGVISRAGLASGLVSRVGR
jgi:hypothetical protein